MAGRSHLRTRPTPRPGIELSCSLQAPGFSRVEVRHPDPRTPGRKDPSASALGCVLVYEELRRLQPRFEPVPVRPGRTLQPTALVHEAYLRLVDVAEPRGWDGCGHFFAAAAEAMRRILVENSRRKMNLKPRWWPSGSGVPGRLGPRHHGDGRADPRQRVPGPAGRARPGGGGTDQQTPILCRPANIEARRTCEDSRADRQASLGLCAAWLLRICGAHDSQRIWPNSPPLVALT